MKNIKCNIRENKNTEMSKTIMKQLLNQKKKKQ